MKAGICGVGAALPEHVITNADWADRLDTSDDWIVRRTGIRERRWLNGDGTLAQLAARACATALEDAGRPAEEVDHVIVSTMTADMVCPGLAPEVVRLLGAGTAGAVDINAACSGFVYGLDQAAALVESGRARTVVVCGAEALSRITDAEDRSTAVLFGDGAGAVVVAAGDFDAGCAKFSIGSDGQHAGLLFADSTDRVLRMSGQEVYRHGVARMASAMREALILAGKTADDLDLLVAHQANARIVETAAAELGVTGDRVMLNVDRVANTSSASIPLALAQAETEGRLHPGATVGLVAFGAGFTWGAGIVSWKERVRVSA